MNVEIERKFLVKSEAWRGLAEGVRFRQGYLQTHPCTVRVRTEGERGVLTIKGQTRGFSREEFEYEIPRGDADRMLDTLALPSLIDKTRGLSSLKSNFPTRGKPLSGPAGLGKR